MYVHVHVHTWPTKKYVDPGVWDISMAEAKSPDARDGPKFRPRRKQRK